MMWLAAMAMLHERNKCATYLIFSNIFHSSPETYFILVIENVFDCFCKDAETRRGSY